MSSHTNRVASQEPETDTGQAQAARLSKLSNGEITEFFLCKEQF